MTQAPPFHLMLDFDGVVFHGLHSNPKYTRLWTTHVAPLLGVREELLVRNVFKTPEFRTLAEGKGDLKDYLARVLPTTGYTGSVDDFVDIWHYEDGKRDDLNHDLLSVVRQIKDRHHIPVCLTTTQEPYRKRHIVENMGLQDLFDAMFFSCDLGITKRDPTFFTKVQTLRGLDPTHDIILFFDDSSDYRAAAASVGWLAQPYETLADFVDHPLIKPLISS